MKLTILLVLLFLSQSTIGPYNIDKILIDTNQATIKTYTQHFIFTQTIKKYENLTEITTLNINTNTNFWNLTELQINFSSIKLDRTTEIIEESATKIRYVNTEIRGLATQLNITEETLLFGVWIFGYSFNPTSNPAYIQIQGYNELDNKPNGTIYGQVLLNTSDTLGWNYQEFPIPITLPIGNYFLVLNWSSIVTWDPNKRHYWYSNENSPQYNLTFAEYEFGFGWKEDWEEVLLHKLDKRVDRTYNPSTIDLNITIDNFDYQVLDGSTAGTGSVIVSSINTPINQSLAIPINNNNSLKLRYNLTYNGTLISKILADGFATINNSKVLWNVTPIIMRYHNNTIKYFIPHSWENITIFKDETNITTDIIFQDNHMLIPNNIITNDSSWLINAESPSQILSIDIPKSEYEANQKLYFSITTPISGNITFNLEDPYGHLEHSETKIVTTSETQFEYFFLDNPYFGSWKIKIYWYNDTDIGTLENIIQIIDPLEWLPLALAEIAAINIQNTNKFNDLTQLLLLIGISTTIILSVIYSGRKIRRRTQNRQRRFIDRILDALNIRYIMIGQKPQGACIYDQGFGRRTEINPHLISSFLHAIRSFGIEALGRGAEISPIIKLEIKGFAVNMLDETFFRVILITSRTPSEELLNSMTVLALEIKKGYTSRLKAFDGELSGYQGIQKMIERAFEVEILYPLQLITHRERLSSEEKRMEKKIQHEQQITREEYVRAEHILDTSDRNKLYKDSIALFKLMRRRIVVPIKLRNGWDPSLMIIQNTSK